MNPQANDNKTEMVSPPVDTTKMVKKEKTVKLRVLREFMRGETMVASGSVIEVPVTEARELLKFKIQGTYSFSGERAESEATHHTIRRVEVYKEPTQIEDEAL